MKKRGRKGKPAEEILDLKSKIKQGLLAKWSKAKILKEFEMERWVYEKNVDAVKKEMLQDQD